MRSKLTAEDVEWLENRLNAAMVPVMPRAGFIHDAKRALFSSPPEKEPGGRDEWIRTIATVLLGIGLVLLFTTVARGHGRLFSASLRLRPPRAAAHS